MLWTLSVYVKVWLRVRVRVEMFSFRECFALAAARLLHKKLFMEQPQPLKEWLGSQKKSRIEFF